jgi:hypothetical protein
VSRSVPVNPRREEGGLQWNRSAVVSTPPAAEFASSRMSISQEIISAGWGSIPQVKLDDEITSIQIFYRATVTIYKDPNFSGPQRRTEAFRTCTAGRPNNPNLNWDNRMFCPHRLGCSVCSTVRNARALAPVLRLGLPFILYSGCPSHTLLSVLPVHGPSASARRSVLSHASPHTPRQTSVCRATAPSDGTGRHSRVIRHALQTTGRRRHRISAQIGA